MSKPIHSSPLLQYLANTPSCSWPGVESIRILSTASTHLRMSVSPWQDFILSQIEDGTFFWIGLNASSLERTWSWVDGFTFDPQLLPIIGPSDRNSCAQITKKGVYSEECQAAVSWICQRKVSPGLPLK
uniref:C-type lectin domain-containing protein n=1 Tax=Ornithorhynchus anatinus TaxID=9258 RepID=A0A6I8NKK5_ORNAN